MPAKVSYQYAWATGWNVPYSSLVNVEMSLAPYTDDKRGRPPVAPPLSLYPVRTQMYSGFMRGDGRITLVWTFPQLEAAALDYIIDTFLVTSSTVVSSKAITINTRRVDRQIYSRCNAYIVLPQPETDYTYEDGMIRNLRITFTKVTVL